MNSNHPSMVTIDLTAISHNLKRVKGRVGDGVKVVAVVKSDAYGHGMVEVARHLSLSFGAEPGAAADAFGVSFAHEGATLRQAGITEQILVMGETLPGEEKALIENSLTPVVSSAEAMRGLIAAGEKAGKRVKLHVKADTGMSRLGLPLKEVIPLFKKFSGSNSIEIEGICTHLAFAFQEEKGKTLEQLNDFKDLLHSLKKEGFHVPLIHVSNSAGIFAFKEAHYGMVRAGIALYGSSPFDHPFPCLGLKPAMRWETRIVSLRTIKEGRSVSYGGTFTTRRESVIATLPVGYSHGLHRNLSGFIEVLIRGKRVPQVGTICMDFCCVDVTDLDDCQIGDRVVLLGADRDEEITIREMADRLGTIPYEISCNVGRLVKKRYYK